MITLVICYKRMWKKFCNWLLYKHLGWTKNVTVDHPSKYIICLAPHTSNWDMPLGQAYAGAEGMRINFAGTDVQADGRHTRMALKTYEHDRPAGADSHQ